MYFVNSKRWLWRPRKWKKWLIESQTERGNSVEDKCQIEYEFSKAVIELFALLVQCSTPPLEDMESIKKLISVKESQIKWKDTETLWESIVLIAEFKINHCTSSLPELSSLNPKVLIFLQIDANYMSLLVGIKILQKVRLQNLEL